LWVRVSRFYLPARTPSRWVISRSARNLADSILCYLLLMLLIFELRKVPRKDKRGADLISDALPFGRLWYGEVSDAIVRPAVSVE